MKLQPDLKRRKMVSIYRGHACLCRKMGRIDNNFVELLYEFSRVAEYYMDMYIYICISICENQTLEN